jgi:hypothetical protein
MEPKWNTESGIQVAEYTLEQVRIEDPQESVYRTTDLNTFGEPNTARIINAKRRDLENLIPILRDECVQSEKLDQLTSELESELDTLISSYWET